jgi:hypothetical protein
MSARCRVVLPVVMGAISLPLMIWDIHNVRVIESMGMAWDTGAPVWPYQTPDILLRFLNGPAYFVASPTANAFRLFGLKYYVTVIPSVLIWWWLVGLRLNRGWLHVSAVGAGRFLRSWPFLPSCFCALRFSFPRTPFTGGSNTEVLSRLWKDPS